MTENQRVLIVEDRQDWQQIIARTMKDLNCTVDLASSYEQALNLLRNNIYDLAIIDPVLDNSNKYNRDGLRVLVEIHQRFPQTGLIVVSGSVTNTSLRKTAELPPRLPLVEKPNWDREAFRSLVRQMLNADYGSKYKLTTTVAAAQKQLSQEMPALPIEAERRGVPRVLIIEDRQDWQVILSRIVEEEGWFWRVVADGEEALDLLRSQGQKFNIVLLDLRLGDADLPIREGQGWKLVDYLGRYEKRTRVIIVSGEASRGDVAALFMQYAIAGFIDKDAFKKTDLLELMENLIAGPKLQFHTLGGFRVWRNGQPIDDFELPEAEDLLKILISRRGEMITFDELSGLLCPDQDTGEARTGLNSIVNAARKALEPDLVQPGDSTFIVRQESAAYTFDFSGNVTIDFEALEKILRDGQHHEREGAYARAIKTYEQALELYQGEYLPADRSAQWTVPMRTHLQTQFVKILNRLADLYARDRRLQEAIYIAQLSLQHDAYHESTYRRLMRYYACDDNPEAALRTYNTLEKLLKEFFEETPGEDTRRLRQSIEAGEKVHCIERLRI